MREIVSTQIRLPADIHEWMKQEAARLGVSMNALLVILLDKGRRVWDADVNLSVIR